MAYRGSSNEEIIMYMVMMYEEEMNAENAQREVDAYDKAFRELNELEEY